MSDYLPTEPMKLYVLSRAVTREEFIGAFMEALRNEVGWEVDEISVGHWRIVFTVPYKVVLLVFISSHLVAVGDPFCEVVEPLLPQGSICQTDAVWFPTHIT